ncbi:MAG: LysM peptidoglycan-binding domain-containing protein, partial [Cytophagales bacterium]|nr:LysM peptidoglycan-binding domain-containing protein [Cytophagales bacterium]
KYIVHSVEEGQTLFAVSKLYKIPMDTIKTWNALSDYTIKLGQQLVVGKKGSKNEQDKPKEEMNGIIIHEVQQGEGLYRISKMYSVTIKEILEWNGKTEPQVSIGEKLKILKK